MERKMIVAITGAEDIGAITGSEHTILELK